MSDTVIRVENLGKKYIIGHQKQERYTALRDVITNKVKSIGSLINPQAKNENPAFEEFWALKDVSFDIKQGDRVGIIGRNGAGKSTLLKILSRITEPTTGSIKIKGRVASLLEVGTGFHPELTGRENIFLNGAILGMGKEEIKRKFDEIVAFAEVEKFLDTPVKRYSSGMYVRLAFAVAAHLEPEILIVDEVLAVGDIEFQKKCLGKMRDVGKEGRTVLFVSHNLVALKQLCSTAIYLKNGEIRCTGNTIDVIKKYLDNSSIIDNYSNVIKTSFLNLENVVNHNNTYLNNDLNCYAGSQCIFHLSFYTKSKLNNCYLNLHIEDDQEKTLIHVRSDQQGFYPCFNSGNHNLSLLIESLNLEPGCYSIWFRIYSRQSNGDFICDSEKQVLNVLGVRQLFHGFVYTKAHWNITESANIKSIS
jgi:ABC-type polysaccharide/polyol phosphate transport system ATPase subunit